jgi:hypothetical protein
MGSLELISEGRLEEREHGGDLVVGEGVDEAEETALDVLIIVSQQFVDVFVEI